MSITQPQRVYL